MTSEYMRQSFNDIADAVNIAHDIEREVLLEIAQGLDERLPSEFARMIDDEGWTSTELSAILEQIEPDSTAIIGERMHQKFDEYWSSPEQKKSRRRDNWNAFLRGLGGVGAGFYAIGEGMSKISIFPQIKK